MKVTCLQEQLAKGLSVVGRAVSTKTTLPVLSNILITTESNEEGDGSGKLKLAATNLEISITVRVPAQIVEAGEITVPARLLNEFVGAIPKETNVTLTLDSSNATLNVQGGRYDANIKGIAAEDFPALPGITGLINNAVINSNVLKEAIGQVAFAAASDESRPTLGAVFTRIEGGLATLVCADSFRLAVKTARLVETADNNFTVLIPARAMTELSRILADDESRVEISVTGNKSQVLFRTEAVNFTCSLVEGNYPNYQQIIPKGHSTRTTAATDQLLQAVKVASLFARDSGNNIIRVAITPGEGLAPGRLTLLATAAEVGDSRNEIDVYVDGGSVENEATQIAFNAKYLQDVLAVMETTQVALELQSSNNPGVFKPIGKDDYIYVIMPMHLAGH